MSYLQRFKQVTLPKRPEIVVFLSLGAFCLAKSEAVHWHLSDENIYYYLAWTLSFGALPYRDFFYANPPLLLVFLKASGALFDWSPLGMRVVPIGAAVLAGWVLFRMFRGSLGALAALPIWIYAFSEIALRASTHATGVNVTLMFLLLAYGAIFQGKSRWGAAFLVLALWTKFYALAALPGLLAALFLSEIPNRRKSVLEFLGWVAAGAVLLALVGSLLGGRAFWEMNIAYHLAKPERSGASFFEVFERVYTRNLMSFVILYGGILVAGASVLARRLTGGPLFPSSEAWRYLAVGGVHLLSVFMFLAPQSRVFDFYFLLFLPGAAFVLAGLLQIARLGWAEASRWEGFAEAALLVASAVLLAQPLVPYEWRFLMKQGSGAPVPYWDHERRHQDRLAEWARELGLPPDATLCGDSATAPVFALAAQVRLALDEADTNAMRFRAGFPSAGEFIGRLEEAEVDYLLVRTERRTGRGEAFSGMFLVPDFQDYLRDSFEPVAMLETDSRTTIRLLGRKAERE